MKSRKRRRGKLIKKMWKNKSQTKLWMNELKKAKMKKRKINFLKLWRNKRQMKMRMKLKK